LATVTPTAVPTANPPKTPPATAQPPARACIAPNVVIASASKAIKEVVVNLFISSLYVNCSFLVE
jgi:hypothetical protein